MSAAALIPTPDLRAQLAEWQKRIVLKPWGQGHRYVLDGGKPLNRVTTVLDNRVSPRLIDWSARVQFEADAEVAFRAAHGLIEAPTKDAFIGRFKALAGAERENQRLLKEAGDLGTELHKLVECWARTKLGDGCPEPNASDKALQVYGRFEEWAASVDLEPVAVEQRLVNIPHRYAGTADLIAFSTLAGERRLDIWDFKTSKGIYSNHRIQSGAYRMALYEMTGVTAGGRLLHFRKDERAGEVPEAIEVQQPLDKLFAAFKAAQTIYQFDKECA